MTDEKIILAEKAARILEDVSPYLAKMEAEALELALGCDRVTDEGEGRAIDYLRLVTVIRGLKGKLDSAVMEGQRRADIQAAPRRIA